MTKVYVESSGMFAHEIDSRIQQMMFVFDSNGISELLMDQRGVRVYVSHSRTSSPGSSPAAMRGYIAYEDADKRSHHHLHSQYHPVQYAVRNTHTHTHTHT